MMVCGDRGGRKNCETDRNFECCHLGLGFEFGYGFGIRVRVRVQD